METVLKTNVRKFSPQQLKDFKNFGERINKLGANFAVSSNVGQVILVCERSGHKSNFNDLQRAGLQTINGEKVIAGGEVLRFDYETAILSAALKYSDISYGVVLIDLGDRNTCSKNYTNENFWIELLAIFLEKIKTAVKSEEHIETMGTEISQLYEELVLLHKLEMNMKITLSDSNFLQMACDSLTDIVPVDGIAIFLEKIVDRKREFALAAGSGLIDFTDRFSNILYSRLLDEITIGKEALIDSDVNKSFKYDWQDNIKSIIAIPLYGKSKSDSTMDGKLLSGNQIIGLIVAINVLNKPEFGSADIKLFSSVGNGCAVFIENSLLFKDLKELFVGSLRALTNSIDAKDQYTRGHSERVGFISRWITEKLVEGGMLTEPDIHRAYLAGLLHDIGKVGIEEAVLRKNGKLTAEEFNCIKTHPIIGAGILREIKQMNDIVPGVLCHHERIDGKGYPNGLIGEQIPIIGKIVNLADSFDAMTSKRTYRDAMSIEKALLEVERGLGLQFDEKIGREFLNSDIYSLWEILQTGFSDMMNENNFGELGTTAVGAIIK
jgi:hypothetical protein